MNTLIGVVTKPQALKGEFRVKVVDEAAFTNLSSVQIMGKTYTVQKVNLRPKFAILKVEGIDTCEQAEALRGKEIYAEKVEAKLKKGEYLASDLIGKEVVGNKGKNFGVLENIENFGSADIFTVKNGKKEIIFPYARNVIIKVEKDIIVDEQILSEIGVGL